MDNSNQQKDNKNKPSSAKVAISKSIIVLLFVTIFFQAAYVLQKERLSLQEEHSISGLISSLGSKFSFVLGQNKQLDSQNSQLKSELKELASLISEREDSLLELSRDKESFRTEVVDLKLQLAQFKRLLDQADKEKKDILVKNEGLTKNMSSLKEDLRIWSGEISNKGEAKLVLARRKQSLKELRTRMSDLRAEARKQIKTITMVLGNQGYLIKNGKTTYADDDTIKLEKIVVIKKR